MDSTTCPYCSKQLPERAIFCGACGRQARCRSCRDILEPQALVCVICGTPVGEGHDIPASGIARSDINTLDFEETRTGRSLHASLTNTAVDSLSGPLGMFVAGHVDASVLRARRAPVREMRVIDNEPAALAAASPEVYEEVDVPLAKVTEPSAPPRTDAEKLRQVFRFDGDQIRLDNTQLKATSKRNAAQRLTYMFLYAHGIEGREWVARTDLKAILEDAELYDGNSRTWIANEAALAKDGDKITLRAPGRKKALAMLEEVLDPSVPDVWPLGSPARRRGTNSSNAHEGQSDSSVKQTRRKSRSYSKKVAAWLEAWEKLGLSVNGHMALQGRSKLDKGIFGLWAIRRAAGDSGKEVSRTDLQQFLWEAFEVKVYERALADALQSEKAKDRVSRVRGVTFQILPPGIEYAERIAGLQTEALAPTTATASPNGSTSSSP